MADAAGSDSLTRLEPQVPAPDPITSKSTSAYVLVGTLSLMLVLGWALYDEMYGLRPWKSMQQEFVEREDAFLSRTKRQARKNETELKASPEFQKIALDAKEAKDSAAPALKEIDVQVKQIDSQLQAITEPFQAKRGEISLDNYRIETSAAGDKPKWIKRRDAALNEKISVDIPSAPGSAKTTRKDFTFPEIDKQFTDLKAKKAELLAKRAEASKNSSELAKKQEDYLKEHLPGLSVDQIGKLQERNNKFDFSMRQINVGSADIVDRCETCHLGVREPLTLTPASMTPRGQKQDELSRAFVSHPNKELLQIHNPDKFGCAACHGGNGRATTTIVKAHGQNPFWLHPLHEKENVEAGCQQCHMADRVLDGAPTLNLGKDLFQQRGCVGCHKSENFDREIDALSNTRQSVTQLEEQIAANEHQSKLDSDAIGNAKNDIEAQRLASHAEYLRVTNSQLAARVEQLNIQSRYLMQDQKKVGPNLKDVRLKLRKEWIPEWLNDPQAFRPGTKMPTFWRLNSEMLHDKRADDERKAIAAYLWQEGFEGKVPQQDAGDAGRGDQLFHQVGCMACHSIGEGTEKAGGDFAANLTKVGQKASYDYIVRWIYNPRARFAPYCPKENRDLTRKDYEDKKLPFVFDTELHSKCPNDGAELQIQNMTVMPNLRLSVQDARDIATYLFAQAPQVPYANTAYMDDPQMKEAGRNAIKQYGCAGCHEIKGFEQEQRIGKELTTEGATPLERLDFALMTGPAEKGIDPDTGKVAKDKSGEVKEWYNHKGFFEHKLGDPSIYDRGKEKDPRDRLRMPKPFLTPEWKSALTTFLIGSVGAEGANVPTTMFYNPDERQKDIQDGWWVVKKYNCMGCHSIQPGQRSVLMDLPLYQNPDWKDQLPPRLSSEGARVDPTWLLRFLRDPSLSSSGAAPNMPVALTVPSHGTAAVSEAASSDNSSSVQGDAAFAPQPGKNANGVRTYLKARMPTFSFSPNELRLLVKFFMAVSSQQEPYIKEPLEPLSDQERVLARQLFTSQAAPCLKCHITGDLNHDKTASAPNFLLAAERLKPEWTKRWLLDPSQISPGTAMPSGLFTKKEDRFVFSGPTPDTFNDYHRDHAELLVRYMFLMTPEEQQKLITSQPTAPAASAVVTPVKPAPSTAHAPGGGSKSAHARARAPS